MEQSASDITSAAFVAYAAF